MIIFSERKLAEDLHVGAITEKQELYYLLIVNSLLAVWTTTTVSNSLYIEKLNLYDYLGDITSLITVAVTIIYAYFVNGKGDGRHFITRYTCLTIPISIKALLLAVLLTPICLLWETDEDTESLFIFVICLIIELFIIWRYAVSFKIASGQSE